MAMHPFETNLDITVANYQALTPLSFLPKAAGTFPEYVSVIDGDRQFKWAETYSRCRRLASALSKIGVGRGDTVSVMAPNVTAAFEATFGIPMVGAIINALNYRLGAKEIAFILNHAETKVLITDTEFSVTIKEALKLIDHPPIIIDIDDPNGPGGEKLGDVSYERFLETGNPKFEWSMPKEEWDSIALNYTSGTTGNPKGVVYAHRGTYLNAIGNVISWGMSGHPVYLWTLPMFHCNGWCFPWTITLLGGTNICLRRVEAKAIYDAIADHNVTHMCGAPIVMQLVAGAPSEEKRELTQKVNFMTAAAPPPAAVLAEMARQNFEVTHVYGLTEVYGPCVVCAWKEEWTNLPGNDQAKLKARQGVAYHLQEDLMVADHETLEPVPKDGVSMGEVFTRGNITMKGYFKNPTATKQAFAGGWFHTGDLGVWHPDGYVELKDRSKDIIISGGENISSIEVEDALYKNSAIAAVGVVGRPDKKWGESPVAFVELKPDQQVSGNELGDFCRSHLAGYKIPKEFYFMELPKTSTGKIQKFKLRDIAKALTE